MNKDRVRQRQSYKMFEQLLRFLNRSPSKRTILKQFYKELDSRYSFGSETNSNYAHESLQLLINDKRLR